MKPVIKALLFCACLLIGFATSCTPTPIAEDTLDINLRADGKEVQLNVPGGTTVQFALEQANITLGNLDRVEPPTYSLVTNGQLISVIRVREEFEIEETTIPFERQTVRNESLPEGQTLLIQPGFNGTQQITYRRVLENEVEVSRNVFKSVVLKEARPEIIMVGVQTPFTPVSIPGTLAYLTAGNAWVMSESTGQRKPIVTTGDLDGRVFTLSPDGEWLLFTRKLSIESDDAINSLWVVNITASTPEPVSLNVENVIHYAGWVPRAGLVIAYSTVEPRETAPGWQANNDLHLITLGSIGGVVRDEELVAPNSGGIYGWWGTDFVYSSDGELLAYARPDGIGMVDLETGELLPMLDIIPLQTRSDWAWVPGIAWSPDGNLLYSVIHSPLAGLTTNEASPLFGLTAIAADSAQWINLVPQTGMFAYPTISPWLDEDRYQIAYLQAIFPDQSETSRYRLMVMDRDGSNRSSIFPPEGASGVEPQKVVWSPVDDVNPEKWLGVMYQGNLWLVNLSTGQNHQITGDGSIAKLDWE